MENGYSLIHSFNSTTSSEGNFMGLTKREYFAAMAMQGIISSGGWRALEIAEVSVKYADALLEELSKLP